MWYLLTSKQESGDARPFGKIQKQSCSVILTLVQFGQHSVPVSNVTVYDHSESGFLWPICLQRWNGFDVNFPDQFFIKWKTGSYVLFSTSHLPNTQQNGNRNLVVVFYFPSLRNIIDLLSKPVG